MNNDLELKRPRWLIILLGIFTAWVSFKLLMIFILMILWMIQKLLNDIEIVDNTAIVILAIGVLISAYLAYLIAKWQKRILDQKQVHLSYFILIVLVVISMITIITPMTYIS